jgi:hypothetical protein
LACILKCPPLWQSFRVTFEAILGPSKSIEAENLHKRVSSVVPAEQRLERTLRLLMPKAGNIYEHVVAGGGAGMVARTCIAPVERTKIMYVYTVAQPRASTNNPRRVTDFSQQPDVMPNTE